MSLEQQLREALRPQDPGEPFTASVMARIAGEAGPAVHPSPAPAPASATPVRRSGLWPVALAASLLLVFIAAQQVLHKRQQDRALAARDQLEQALSITSAELQQLQQRLNPEQ